MRFLRFFEALHFLFLIRIGESLLEERLVSFEPIASNNASQVRLTQAPIIVADDDFIGVHIAAENLASDLAQITEHERAVKRLNGTRGFEATIQDAETAIIAGSSNSTIIRHLVSTGSLNISDIEGKWETFKTTTVSDPLPGVKQALVIAGSDKRGTVYGIYTLSEQSGQSPYHWFADVPAKKHTEIYALPKQSVQGEPSVKYRGLFINDEEPALNSWWSRAHNATRQPLDSEFYAHVFDLLLRLKANYLWPAMWRSVTPPPGNIFFTDDAKNQQLADDYGIVISTAHHEPMQRATNEWDEKMSGPWDWSKNRQNMTEFMEEGVRRAGNNESYFTVGLRGLGDEAAANAQNAIPMLKEVFEVQREIIKKYHGSEMAVPQVWALYKEVAAYYDAGLDPPEDITLLFPDDNWGNVYRLPTGPEVDRKGGTGVYFHFEYVGLPRSYKWSNTNSIPKTYKELSHAYLRGATQIWIVNVGDLKPMELPLNFAMDMAWDVTKFSFENIPEYLTKYAAREFGDEHADEIGSLLLEYSHLVSMRRYELVTPETYSTLNYNEAERIFKRWQDASSKAKALYGQVTPDLKPAFYQLVYYPIASGALYHKVQAGISTNYRSALERRNSANLVAQQILDDFEASYDLVEEWDAMLDGKWANMMSQAYFDAVEEPKRWAGPSRNIVANLSYVQLRENMQFSLGNLGIRAEGSLSAVNQGRWAESVDNSMPTTNFAPVLPPLDPYGPSSRHVDLFMRGDHRIPISWSLDPIEEDWLSIAPSNGTLSRETGPDTRFIVTVPDWSKVPANYNNTIKVGIRSSPSAYPYYDQIHIPIQNFRLTSDVPKSTFPETDGIISIEAPHFSSSSNSSDGVSFVKIPYLGSRTSSGCIALRPFKTARSSLLSSTNTSVTYSIYLFSPTNSISATVLINSGLDTDPHLKMQYSLTLDSAPANFTRVLGDYIKHPNAGDIPPEWMAQVADNVWTKQVQFKGPFREGLHTLTWRVNSPEVYLEKIVLDLKRGILRASYLGPEETFQT
ncbi:hypothetical protein V8F06_005780 [Rhypophila decipiens]